MRRQTQIRLYYALPVVFWLLAVGGSIIPIFVIQFSDQLSLHNYIFGYLVTALVLVCIVILGRIKRHESAVMPCFHVAILLAIGSYWLPTVVFLTIPFWIYLAARHLFDMRAFMATLTGYALVAVWATIVILLGWLSNPWGAFFVKENALGWIPLGAILFAWFISTIARQNLRVR